MTRLNLRIESVSLLKKCLTVNFIDQVCVFVSFLLCGYLVIHVMCVIFVLTCVLYRQSQCDL